MPAVYFLRFATDGTDGLAVALLFAVVPIAVTGSIIFAFSCMYKMTCQEPNSNSLPEAIDFVPLDRKEDRPPFEP